MKEHCLRLEMPLRFGEILVRNGVAAQEALDRALADQKGGDKREIGAILIAKYGVPEVDIHRGLCKYLEMMAAAEMEKRFREQLAADGRLTQKELRASLAKAVEGMRVHIRYFVMQWAEEWVRSGNHFIRVSAERQSSQMKGKMEFLLEFLRLSQFKERISFTCFFEYAIREKRLVIYEDQPLTILVDALQAACIESPAKPDDKCG
ncbi:MAG: hypothetical protein HQK81_04565 [Desulfovibrionaceae bacterium]|nr:hypothetical protein [Desulfovibrionaceae bacterium]MBF0513318.1 hypothetical protein [Desulfovibrionaceae bacterium]